MKVKSIAQRIKTIGIFVILIIASICLAGVLDEKIDPSSTSDKGTFVEVFVNDDAKEKFKELIVEYLATDSRFTVKDIWAGSSAAPVYDSSFDLPILTRACPHMPRPLLRSNRFDLFVSRRQNSSTIFSPRASNSNLLLLLARSSQMRTRPKNNIFLTQDKDSISIEKRMPQRRETCRLLNTTGGRLS